jgi:hypothetical protein
VTFQGLKIDDVDRPATVLEPSREAFDPLTQVSADAKYIVERLVAWFIGLPLLLGALAYALYLGTR